MATTLNLNALPEYINEHKDELFVKAVAGNKTLDYIDIMAGVKHKDAIPFLDSEVVLAEGACGWNPAGSDTIAEKVIEVVPVSIQKEWCWLSMQEKFLNYQLKFEAGRETLPFEQKFAESNMNAIQEAVEEMIWQGNSTLDVDGLLAQAAADDDVIDVTFTSGQTISDRVDAMVVAAPIAALKKGVNLFLSYTDYRAYVAEMNGTCCANRPVIDAANDSIVYSGDSRITIVPVLGLEGTNKMVLAPASELIYGTDIEGSEGTYRLFYDEKERKFCFDVLFNAGTAIRIGSEVVLGA